VADDPLETIYGIGYRLRPAQQDSSGAAERSSKRAGKRPSLQTSKSKAAQKTVVAATKVWQQAKESLNHRVAVVEQATTLLLQDKLSEELRQQAEQEAHRLAGSLGMFGADEGSRLAQAIEPLLATGVGLDQNQIQQLSQLVVGLRRELQQMGKGADLELLSVSASNASTGDSADQLADQRPCLLIVHADRAMAETLAAEAASWGMRSHIATAASARKLLAKQPPDAALLDFPVAHSQPGNAAPETLALLAELNQCTPAVPAIVLTEQEQLIDRVSITRLGGRRILQKPVSAAEVLETLVQVLQHTRTEARVMVVDDDPQVLMALRALLVPWGIKVFTLDNPLQFLETLRIASPDLLVLDVEMPHIRGIELCQVVRNDPQWSGLPVLFLTAHADAETMHRVFAAGADDYVSKPIVGPELVTRILNRLERSRLLQNLADMDSLTGVANRRKSTQELNQMLQWSQRHHQPFCLAILGLDQLKPINHQYGHAAGDQVLFRFGKLLRQTFQSEDVVGRWGGTEFAIGMIGLTQEEGVQRLAEVVNSLRQIEFVTLNGTPFRITCSAGVVQSSPDADLQTLYQYADGVLSQAKAAGGDRILHYCQNPAINIATGR
jgi:diguanylate cyclase (GGDEF)-like protein